MRSMNPFRPVSRLLLLGALLAGALITPARARAQVPPLDHVIVVIMENKSYDQVRTAAYTASLITNYSTCTNSFAVTHPSQPNYIALWAGSTLGVVNDACPAPGSPYSAENLGHACEVAGRSWRAYSEGLPNVGDPVCATAGNSYTRKHDPWTDFANLDHTRERPYTDLAVDIAAHTLPNLAFVVPNNCDNTHDCAVATGDAWLAANLPAMISAVGPNGVVILTWDEDNNLSGNHILTVFAGPTVRTGYASTATVTHYGILRTIGDALGLPPIGAAVSAAPVIDVWAGFPTSAPTRTWGQLKSVYR